jgi:hypothetical protein
MLTGIYVYDSTTLTFNSTESITLIPYASGQSPISVDVKTLQATVPAGIYKIETNDSVNTGCTPASASANVTVFESPNTKDPAPDPPGQARVLYTDKESLCTFFDRPDARSAAFPTSAH